MAFLFKTGKERCCEQAFAALSLSLNMNKFVQFDWFPVQELLVASARCLCMLAAVERSMRPLLRRKSQGP